MKKAANHDRAVGGVSFEQEHLQWHVDHLNSLAMLRRLEAHLFTHEAEIAAHRAEIASESDDSDRSFASQHDEARHHHRRLTKAILALGELL